MSPSIQLLSLGPKYMFPLTPRCEDTKGCRSHYCHTSYSVSLTQIQPEAPHMSKYIILLHIETQTKTSMQRSTICVHMQLTHLPTLSVVNTS
jgi:hypothetical protein